MTPVVFRPDVKFRHKLFVIAILFGALAVAFSVLLGLAIGNDAGGGGAAVIGAVVAVLINALWLVPVLIFIPFYYRSLRYEIQEDEVIVHVGVITKSVKHVPFRTVTNLKVTRGPFDRLFGIGALTIQTAGMSGQTGAEERLVGLPNYQAIYEQVATALRRFRGAMAPTQAEDELAPADGQVLTAILDEVQIIRKSLERS